MLPILQRQDLRQVPEFCQAQAAFDFVSSAVNELWQEFTGQFGVPDQYWAIRHYDPRNPTPEPKLSQPVYWATWKQWCDEAGVTDASYSVTKRVHALEREIDADQS